MGYDVVDSVWMGTMRDQCLEPPSLSTGYALLQVTSDNNVHLYTRHDRTSEPPTCQRVRLSFRFLTLPSLPSPRIRNQTIASPPSASTPPSYVALIPHPGTISPIASCPHRPPTTPRSHSPLAQTPSRAGGLASLASGTDCSPRRRIRRRRFRYVVASLDFPSRLFDPELRAPMDAFAAVEMLG